MIKFIKRVWNAITSVFSRKKKIAVKPTGTTSVLSGRTTGVHPGFKAAYVRKGTEGDWRVYHREPTPPNRNDNDFLTNYLVYDALTDSNRTSPEHIVRDSVDNVSSFTRTEVDEKPTCAVRHINSIPSFNEDTSCSRSSGESSYSSSSSYDSGSSSSSDSGSSSFD